MPVASLMSAAVLATVSPARGDDVSGTTVSALLGYSLAQSGTDGATNTAGPGIGLRASYTFESHFSLSAMYVRHFGLTRGWAKWSLVSSGDLAYYGVEPGYDIALSRRLVLRPSLGIGLQMHFLAAQMPLQAGGAIGTESVGPYLTAWPGVGLSAAFGSLRVGVDARYMIEASGAIAYGPAAYATWGVHF